MSLEFWCPLRLEAWAARRGAGTAGVVRTGMGPRRSEAFAGRRAGRDLGAAVVLGLAGAVTDSLEPGDVIVADVVGGPGPDRPIRGPASEIVRAGLREAGIDAVRGPVRSVAGPVHGARRHRLAREGALAADMESWWLLAADPPPVAVIRVVSDTPSMELASLWLPLRVRRALAMISRIAATLDSRETPIGSDTGRRPATAASGGIS